MEVIEINPNNSTNFSIQNNNNENKNLSFKRINSSITYDEFFTEFLQENRPCIIQSGAINNWPCDSLWKQNGAPNLNHLQQVYGESEVPVANCQVKYYNAHEKITMKMNEFLNYWRDYKNKNYHGDLLYLKDWHCSKDYPNISFYEVPKFFASDWLNEYYLEHRELNDDYMFVYMGPKGSWTPFHVDVFTSYSWSANIVGKKRWLIFRPGDEKCLYDIHGNLPHDIDTLDNNLPQKNHKNAFEIIQETGEIVFIPSGYFHQVTNLEDTISINHNWINSCNILNVWNELKNGLSAVMKEIEDCKNMDNWHSQCQILLKATHGMDYFQFYQFISFIIKKRINSLNKKNLSTCFNKWKLGLNHSIFDLKCAKHVLENLINDTNDKNIFNIIFHNNSPVNLVKYANDTLECINKEK